MDLTRAIARLRRAVRRGAGEASGGELQEASAALRNAIARGDVEDQTGRARAIVELATLIEQALSHDDVRDQLRAALRAAFPDRLVFIRDVFDDRVVWEDEGAEGAPGLPRLFRQGYVVVDGKVTLVGAPEEVVAHTVYEPVVVEGASPEPVADRAPLAEAVDLVEFSPLVERGGTHGCSSA